MALFAGVLPWLSGALGVPAPFLLAYALVGATSVVALGWVLQGLECMPQVAIGSVGEREEMQGLDPVLFARFIETCRTRERAGTATLRL